MITKDELKNKIRDLENKVSELKQEKNVSEKEFSQLLNSKVLEAVEKVENEMYERWKTQNAHFVKRYIKELLEKQEVEIGLDGGLTCNSYNL